MSQLDNFQFNTHPYTNDRASPDVVKPIDAIVLASSAYRTGRT
jgi:hypothetical protein